MRRFAGHFRVLRYAAQAGYADRTAIFSLRTWTCVGFTRVVTEITFYALIGLLLESTDRVAYLLVGSSVLMAATTTILSVQSTAWERMAGTLPLLVASPTGPLIPFLGRSVMWIPDALAFSFGGLLTTAVVFRVDLPLTALPWTLPLLLACSLGTYGLSAFIGALIVRTAHARNLASNVVRSVMGVVTGASVPVAFFPDWVGWLSNVFPATFALRGVRHVLAGGSVAGASADMFRCLSVGSAWLLLAAAVLTRFIEHVRADGSIEFGGV